ncbi:hypothetical protein NQ318_020791 [Aromia moschata]|uniref:Uncharacterized protein n=1 Tax=Aromia moschata TaxID=1265417 RepID=A0AAV8YCQ3_9CUCU|nr:hypothetical protein NQ318_020791 [Aromia moschata]
MSSSSGTAMFSGRMDGLLLGSNEEKRSLLNLEGPGGGGGEFEKAMASLLFLWHLQKIIYVIESSKRVKVQDNLHSTTRQMGIDFNLSHTSVRNTLHKQKFHPYKITLMQDLSEDDFDRRNEFYEIMQIRCNDDENFALNILFSDEASFFST